VAVEGVGPKAHAALKGGRGWVVLCPDEVAHQSAGLANVELMRPVRWVGIGVISVDGETPE